MRVAAANVHPVWGDPEATAKVAVSWIERAAADDAELIAFGETFLGGYPFWLSETGGARFDDPAQKSAYAFYLERAVELDGPHVAAIAEAAVDHEMFVYIGVAERVRSSVYCTLVAIDPEHGLVSAHRKLRPTYEEGLVWASGDGHGLRSHRVREVTVGGLNCWENWMPQARHALYAGGEHLHVSVWPGAVRNTIDITRFVALEGRVWSLAAGTMLGRDDVSPEFPLFDMLDELDAWPAYDGGSAVAAPDGSWAVEPVSDERLVFADIDAGAVARARQNFDPTGHYSRPDVFDVRVNRRRLDAVHFDDGQRSDES